MYACVCIYTNCIKNWSVYLCVCVCKHDHIQPFIKSLLTVYRREQDSLFNRAPIVAEGNRQTQKALQKVCVLCVCVCDRDARKECVNPLFHKMTNTIILK